MVRRAGTFVLLLLLAGCSAVTDRPAPGAALIKPPATATEAIGIAQDMVRRGRWSDGIAVLDAAAQRFGDDPAVLAERQRLQALWEHVRRTLEDELLVGDAEAQHNKIVLLERYSLAEPDNLVVTSRRIYWKELLAGKLEPLTACGERHAATNAALARRCYQVASTIAATPDVERRLAGIDEQLRANEEIAAQRRRMNEQRERQARARVLLDNAKRAIEDRDYRRALDILQNVAQLQPSNREVAGLQQQALSLLGPQVEALVKLGDHLYLDEQLEAAVATWQAALDLAPDDADILARIERAKNVLDRLDALRRQQQAPTADR